MKPSKLSQIAREVIDHKFGPFCALHQTFQFDCACFQGLEVNKFRLEIN